jgi:hypothetical protein
MHVPYLLLHATHLFKQLLVNDKCLLESVFDLSSLLLPHLSVSLVIKGLFFNQLCRAGFDNLYLILFIVVIIG